MKGIRSKNRKILLSIMVFVLLCAFGAYGWYIVTSEVDNEASNIRTEQVNGLEVKVRVEGETGSEDYLLSAVDEDGKIIDIGLVELTNIESGKIAPGAFGEIHFKIHNTSTYFDAYELRILPDFNYVSNVLEDGDPLGINNGKYIYKSEMDGIVTDHIRFFKTKAVDELTGEITYGDVIGYESEKIDEESVIILKMSDDIEKDEEKEITIYWCWPYDFDEYVRHTESDEIVNEENIRNYDIEDTKMGNFLSSIDLKFEVYANQNID